MLEKLKAYLQMFQQEKLAIETQSDEDAITELLLKYEAELRERFKEEKAQKISAKLVEIQCIERLIALEQQPIDNL